MKPAPTQKTSKQTTRQKIFSWLRPYLPYIIAIAIYLLVSPGLDHLPTKYEDAAWVSFYQAKNCVDFTTGFTNDEGKGCHIVGSRENEDLYSRREKYLDESISNILWIHEKFEPSKLPAIPYGWECWSEGREISDPSLERIYGGYYKCWPKE